MRIELTRDNLLSQLPDGDLPDTLILEGREVGLVGDPLAEKYPEEYDYFTRIHWDIFKRLLEGPAHFRQLAVYANPRKLNHQNIVAVHILSMRKQLRAVNAPWEIRSRRRHGIYTLHRKR